VIDVKHCEATMSQLITKVAEIIINPNLSNKELEFFLDRYNIPGHVILYRELPDYLKKLEEDDTLSLIIFFGFPGNIGHWCALWIDKDGYYHFFDPYGNPPDAQWQFVYNEYKESRPAPILSNYLKFKKFRYNPYNIQGYLIDKSFGPITKEIAESSCGELIILRLTLKDIPDKVFFELIKTMKPQDVYFITKEWIYSEK